MKCRAFKKLVETGVIWVCTGESVNVLLVPEFLFQYFSWGNQSAITDFYFCNVVIGTISFLEVEEITSATLSFLAPSCLTFNNGAFSFVH